MSFETHLMLKLVESSEPAGRNVMAVLAGATPGHCRPAGLDLVWPDGQDGLV